jgi:phage repressor protein C with HTH and peptisase S24 domain
MTTIKNIYQFIENQSLNVSEFSKKIGVSNGYFAKQKASEGAVGSNIIEKIVSTYPDLNANWLITGKGSMFNDTVPIATPIETSPKSPARLGNPKPLLPHDAIAGIGLGAFDDLKVERYYDVYEFRNADFLIKVKGGSMYPKYNSGDILACKLVKERLFFQWNKCHVLFSQSQGFMVKRICKALNAEYIICKSDNKDYEPFEVPLSDIQDIAIVMGVIRLE